MNRHRHPGVLRRFHRQLHFIERECGPRARPRSPSIVAVELDPIGPSADLIAHGADKAVDAIGFLGALRYAPFRSEAFRRVTSGSDDRARGSEHSGTGNDSLLDSLLQ